MFLKEFKDINEELWTEPFQKTTEKIINIKTTENGYEINNSVTLMLSILNLINILWLCKRTSLLIGKT